ncbi:MAG: hypothetical protein IJV04_03355 [Lachnospiraceae bacterium]|nr:hypothetical protein [Lachnospiraceae bacterium]
MDTEISLFDPYDYDACRKYDMALDTFRRKESELAALKEAQSSNTEFLQLAERVTDLEKELSAIETEINRLTDDKAQNKANYQTSEGRREQAEYELSDAKEALAEFESANTLLYQNAISDFDRFLQAGGSGSGGTLKDRNRAERAAKEAEDRLKQAQFHYNATRGTENPLPSTEYSRADYQRRKDHIWMDDRQEIYEELKKQTRRYESIFKNEFVLTVLKSCEAARSDLRRINTELARLDFRSHYAFDVKYIKDGSDYERILEYAKYLKEREELGSDQGQMTLDALASYSNEEGKKLEKEIREIINRIVGQNNKDQLDHFADYRNYMNYEILISDGDVLNKAKLSRQSGFNSGAEVQIPYMLILLSALLIIYNDKTNSTRLVFIDEPFAKMDPSNVRIMMGFMKEQNLQMIFCAPDKTELIGRECQVILPVLRTRPDFMEIGIVEIKE